MTRRLLQPNVTARFKIGITSTKQWRWCLVSGYGTPIITWQHRRTKESCEAAIALVKAASDAPIEFNALTY